jgi:hypothetical protein
VDFHSFIACFHAGKVLHPLPAYVGITTYAVNISTRRSGSASLNIYCLNTNTDFGSRCA